MFDLICLNVIYLLAIKMALHLIIINFLNHTLMQGTQINIFVQKGHSKNTWEFGNLGNSLSNSLVTV